MAFDDRSVTDPRGLRALAHPTRLALLELLAYEGPLTATEAGEHLGESPASCSFHLRQLAKHGYIEEAGGGSGRQRPWRVVRGADYTASESDPETALAGAALTQVVEATRQQRLATWQATARNYPPEWQEAAFASYRPTFLTAAELKAMGEAIDKLFEPFRGRMIGDDPRPKDGLPAALIMHGFPVAPPAQQRPPRAQSKKGRK
ncbi:MAG TPA: helix-turn-helix domain-containing protein [Acidothermaceae bacterium]|nr:helix-turn-helix domain-containing protein [Acidothermaceae bacterium]